MEQETSYYERPQPIQQQVNSMATSAMVLAVISVASTFMIPVYLPCITGSVAIVMALLSRGSTAMAFRAKAALLISLISIIVNICILITGIYMLITVPELQEEFKRLLESMEVYQ